MTDFLKQIHEYSLERVKNPLLVSILSVWIIIHYDVTLTLLFSEISIEEKIAYIKAVEFNWLKDVLFPFIVIFIHQFAFPFVNYQLTLLQDRYINDNAEEHKNIQLTKHYDAQLKVEKAKAEVRKISLNLDLDTKKEELKLKQEEEALERSILQTIQQKEKIQEETEEEKIQEEAEEEKIQEEAKEATEEEKIQEETDKNTIVIPAQERGFNDVFIGENRWYPVSLNEETIKNLKYIAAYQLAPIKAITHYAKIKSIKLIDKDTKLHRDHPIKSKAKKFEIIFDGEAKEMKHHIKQDESQMITLRNMRYTTFEKLQSSTTIAKLFPK